ncbi:MAG: pyridoxal phosphate-dependent aminotransferase [Paracoccaceae bacterium]
MDTPRYTPLIASLPAAVPFVGPEVAERARGAEFAARLGANENVFGPSPRAIAAMAEAAKDVWKYGDSASADLRAGLAAHHGIAAENIVIGEGIDGLLGQLVRLLIEPGDRIVTSAGGYPTFNYHVLGYGGVIEAVPYVGDAEDARGLVERAAACGAKLLYIANPDNPMGSVHSADVIEAMVEAVPPGCLLILDEAYIEFAPEGTAPRIDPDDPRVIRFRTFSKAYGMAGARVGYGIAARGLVSAFDKIRNHFGMGRISQAGAMAALKDQDYLRQVIEKVAQSKARIADIARDNGLVPLPSATNFVTIDCGADGDFSRRIVAELGARDIFIRMPFMAPQDRCIRISAGRPAHLDLLAARLPEALKAARI